MGKGGGSSEKDKKRPRCFPLLGLRPEPLLPPDSPREQGRDGAKVTPTWKNGLIDAALG